MVTDKKQVKKKEIKTQILLVDDHPVVRDGLTTIINHQQDLNVCGGADDAHQALTAISELRPDVVVVDISLKSSDGIELTKSIKSRYPKLPVVVLSVHDEMVYAERALRAGARAYLMKEVVSENIVVAIRKVLKGDIFVSEAISKRFLHKLAGDKACESNMSIENLSDRELEIFHLIGEGYKASQIANKLHISVKTVETYRGRLKEKLNLDSAAELLQYAIKWTKSEDKK